MADMSWVFRLFDQMSGPANNIAKAVHASVEQLDAAAAGTKKMTAAQRASLNTQARVITAYSKYVGALVKVANAQRVAQKGAASLALAQQKAATAAANAAAAQAKAQAAQARAQTAQLRLQRQLAGGGAGGGGGHGGHGGGGRSWWQTGLGIAGYYVAFRAATAMAKAVTNAATILPRSIISGGIEHTAMKESTVAGMSVVLGDKSKAQALVKEAIRFAAITPMTTEESIKGYQQLVMGGLDPSKVMGVMSAISDLSSINMDRRSEAVSNIARDIMEVQAAGKVTGRHLMNLSNWGLPREELYRQLAGGIIPQLKGASQGEVADAIHKGKVSAEAFFYAFEQTMAKKGGGMLGGISATQSRTMSGLWSTLISRPQELLMSMDRTPAWDSLKKALENLVNVTDYNSPTGQRMQQVLSDAFSQWVNKLTSWLSDPVKVEQWINRLMNTLDALIPTFSLMASATASIAENFAKVAAVITGTHTRFDPKDINDPEMARRTLADPNASEITKAWARKVLERVPPALRPNGASHTFNINVQAQTKEDAKVVADGVYEKISSLFEQFTLQNGTP